MSARSLMIFSLFAMASLFTSAVWAHDKDDKLGPDASDSDYYRIECNDNGQTAYLEISLRTTKKAPALVSAQVSTHDYSVIKNITDPVNGDKQSSLSARISNQYAGDEQASKGADGPYYVAINKNKAGVVPAYRLTYHCWDKNGVHTPEGTTLTPLQNR